MKDLLIYFLWVLLLLEIVFGFYAIRNAWRAFRVAAREAKLWRAKGK